MTDKTITYRRDELYEEVWREPLRTVAQRYGISDVALGRMCRRLRVPLPGKGYWARIRVGQHPARPPLPDLLDGMRDTIAVRRRGRAPDVTVSETSPSTPPIVVPTVLRHPHKLVSEASRLLRNRTSDDGLVYCWSTRCLDITVAPESLGRALRVMHALITALEERGLRVEVTAPRSYEQRCRPDEDETPGNATRVLVAGEWICFGLFEKRSVTRPTPVPPKGLTGAKLETWIVLNQPRMKLVPSGTLELLIKSGEYLGVRTLWHDGKRKRVEDCLDDFIAHLHAMAGAIKRHRVECERVRRERMEQEARRLEEERRCRDEAERIKRFEDDLRRWRLARDIREYVAEVRGIVGSMARSSAEDPSLLESLQWAESYANRIDPLTPMREKVDHGQTLRMAAAQDAVAESDEALAE